MSRNPSEIVANVILSSESINKVDHLFVTVFNLGRNAGVFWWLRHQTGNAPEENPFDIKHDASSTEALSHVKEWWERGFNSGFHECMSLKLEGKVEAQQAFIDTLLKERSHG